MRFLEASTLVSLLCLTVSLRPTSQDEPDLKPTLSPGSKAAIAKLSKELQGAWRLTALQSPLLEKKARQEVGFMLIADNYFSFEMHLGWLDNHGQMDEKNFLSGTHRFEIDERMRMTSASVIGSSINRDGKLQFEPPGRARVYEVVCAADRLTLKREDGTKFEFDRLVDIRARRDIYGRPLEEKEPPPPKKN